MAAFASLANVPIVSGRLTIPSQGLWHADLALATDSPAVPISPSQTLILGTITATCTVVRLTPWTGEVKARVVGGAGGWTTTLPGKQYSMLGGSIPTSMVVGDAARAVGEATPLLDDPAGVTSLGPNYFRAYGPAGALLWALTDTGVFPNGWWMDLSGVVHTETIPVSTISSDFRSPRSTAPADGTWYSPSLQLTGCPGPRSRVRLDVVQCPAWSTDWRTTGCRRRSWPHEHGPSDRYFARGRPGTGPEAGVLRAVGVHGHVAAPNGVGDGAGVRHCVVP